MKKPLSPVLIGSIIAAALVVFGGIFVFGTTPPEIPGGKKLPGYKEGIPDYVRKAQDGERSGGPGANAGGQAAQVPPQMGSTDNLTAEQRAKIEESIQKAGAGQSR